jgi:hypothetical protein
MVGHFEGEPIFHVADFVRCRQRGEYGRLFVGRDRLIFMGDRRIELPLAQVCHMHVGYENDFEVLSIQLAGKKSVTKFWFDSGLEFVAKQVRSRITHAQAEPAITPASA